MEIGVWHKLAWLAVAGALGTLARYGLTGLVQRAAPNMAGGFSWGTLAVNVLGCFLFGLVWSLAESGWAINNHVRVVVFIGFLGAFTTFSTYAFEAGQMLRDAQWLSLAIHVVAQNGLGLAAILLGLAMGRSG